MRCFKWKLVLRIVLCFVFSNISVIFEKVMFIPCFDSPNDVLNDFKTKAFRERLAWLLPRLKLFSRKWFAVFGVLES